MDTTQSTTPVDTVKTPGIFATKIPSSIAFAIGVLLFFMPFIDIKCNDVSLQKVNGLELATGFHIKGPGGENSLFDNFENTRVTNNRNMREQKDPNSFALAALGLGVAGLLLSLLNNKAGAVGGLVTGAFAVVAMIALMVDIKADISDQLKGKDPDISIAVEFAAGFYLSLLSFLGAAYFSYRRWKEPRKPAI